MSAVTVDFATSTGIIKPLRGVNNGPVGFGSMLDNSHRYRELGVPYVRLHDTNWPHPREVDVPQMFPDFDADPDDPASYCFGPTDDYLRSILATGARIIYRLGVSIEHYARKRYTDPPANLAKWARIALGIARHYGEGWADGIPNAVDYWEIWNEPELSVGGYAAANPNGPRPAQFMAYCRDHDLPLDFFSWHTYARHPDEFLRREGFERLKSEEGAVLVANFGALEGRVSLSIKGLPTRNARREILMVDRDHNLEPWVGAGSDVGAFMADQPHHEQAPAAAGTDRIELLLRRHSVCLVRIGPEEGAEC